MNKDLNRSTINYIIDIATGAAFLLSVLSGILLLFLPSGSGFQGGRNTHFTASILGMDRWFIKDLHSISSIVMAAGVLGHFILHWNWIVCMTRKILNRKNRSEKTKCEIVM